MRKTLSLTSLSLAVLLSGTALAADPLLIGVPTSRTGTYAVLGDQVVRAITFAADEVNAAGGVDGHKVIVKVADDEGNPDAGRRVAEKLTLEGYKILTGSISSAVGLALSAQLNRWDALYVSVVNKSPKLTGDSCHPRMFRANHSDDMDLAIVAPWLKEQAGQNWGIIAADYLWGRGSAAAFKKAAGTAGKNVKLEVYSPLGTADYAPFITQLRDGGIDGLWVAMSGSDAINFAKQARQFGLLDKVVTFGHNFVVPSTISAVGKDAVGVWGNLSYSPSIDTPANKAFVAAWKAKHGTEPTDYEGESYTGAQLIFQAVRQAKSTKPADVAKAMNGLSVNTPYGTLRMRAEDHQLEMPNYLGRVSDKGGAIAIDVVKAFDAATATPAPSADCKL